MISEKIKTRNAHSFRTGGGKPSPAVWIKANKRLYKSAIAHLSLGHAGEFMSDFA